MPKPDLTPNAVRRFDSEILFETLARREIMAARYLLNEAERCIQTAQITNPLTLDRIAGLYARLYQRAQGIIRDHQKHLDLIQASRILREEPELIR